MTPLTLSRSEKKAYGKAVGEILARDYGKQTVLFQLTSTHGFS